MSQQANKYLIHYTKETYGDSFCTDLLEQYKMYVQSAENVSARRVGVHRQSVNRWARKLAECGRAGLKQAGRAGRKPRLGAVALKKLEAGLKRGPQALGYETALWTARRVAHLIGESCGVTYHPGHVWRILRQLGWSCQRPTGWALERDEAAIWRWKKERWPALKKRCQPHRAMRPKGGPSTNCSTISRKQWKVACRWTHKTSVRQIRV